MAGQLLTLPVRLGLRAGSLLVRGGSQLAGQALDAGLRIAGLRGDSESAGDTTRASRSAAFDDVYAKPAEFSIPPHDSAPEPSVSAPLGDLSDPDGAEDLYAPEPPEPAHVSEEPVLVEELAEAGAEDGAGANIHIAEPWTGYRELHADEVIALASESDPGTLAAIQLYESSHKSRQSVLEAVERQLQLLSRGGASN